MESAGEVTAAIGWVMSKSALDRFCKVVMLLQHQQPVLARGQDLVL